MTGVSRDALKRAPRDPVFVDALWLLTRLPQDVTSKDFGAAIADIGMRARPPTSVTELMVAYNSALERVQQHVRSGVPDLVDIACETGAASLAEAMAGMPMWSPIAADVQVHCRR